MSQRHLDILLVDDDPGDCRLVQETLGEGRRVSKVHVVNDGDEALDYLKGRGAHKKAARPDLVLLDLNMPRKDGREALKELKSDPKLRRIPVVVLTTSKAEEDVVRSYDLGVNSFITKPVDFQQFVDVVKTLTQYWLQLVQLPPRQG